MEKLAPGDGLRLVTQFEDKRRFRSVRVAVKQQARLTPVISSMNSRVSELGGAKMEADQIIRHEPPVFHGLERFAFRVSATDFVWGGRAFVEGPVKRFNHGSKVRISVVSPLPLRCHCLAAFCRGKRSRTGTAVGDTAASGRELRDSAKHRTVVTEVTEGGPEDTGRLY
jgi:hypothetical protein